MAEWAYACRQPGKDQDVLYISAMAISDLPAEQRVVRVKVGPEWRCAVVDRSGKLEVASQLIRPVIASSLTDCPQCQSLLQDDDTTTHPHEFAPADEQLAAPTAAQSAGEGMIQAAIMHEVAGGVAVVLVPLPLVQSPGEARMAAEDLQPYFAGMQVVLVAQDEAGKSVFYGDAAVTGQLQHTPLEELPWEDRRLT